MRCIIPLIAIIFAAGCISSTNPATTTSAAPTTIAAAESSVLITAGGKAEMTVEITSAGFNPASVEINKGDTVTWLNKDASPSWPASALHPTHALYPETGGCVGSKFDACKDLAFGEKFSFAFDHAGTWKYHDHLNPGRTGTVVVK